MKKMLRFFVVSVLCTLWLSGLSFADESSIVGKWKTIDDKTNQPKAIVQIYEQDGKYFGKVVDLFRKPSEEQNPICDKCSDSDPRKDKPIRGMVILTDMEKDGDEYDDGDILDTKDGSIYSCEMKIEDGKLQVRGYIGFSLFGRTQTWHRVE
ncbi:MAG: DUF2147 domain-containing protein [Pseudomonadota bacterium]